MGNQSKRELEIFNSALEQGTPAERVAYLNGACGDDVELRARIETLLNAHDGAGGFLPTDDPKSPAKTIVMTPDMVPVTEKPGDHIGRYKLLQKIGEGGCGVVYVAEQAQPVRRRVALKVIKLGMDTKSVIARFEAERQALAMMDHPNIAKVLDAGTTDAGRPYFVMELVRGIRITEYCDQNQLTTQERLDLFVRVCQAIQHAHLKGIIHRDIKPSNILVTLHDGLPVPKVIDFGIAKATEGKLTDATVYTQLNQFIGTPAYMSPEQAEMSGLDIDTRSDIYSLGVLLYELLTGATPFDAQELVKSGLDAMRKTILEKEPLRPSTRLNTMLDSDLTAVAHRHGVEPPKLVHLIKGDLDWIVMKSLEKDRTRRYETATGLAADIKRHLDDEPVVARPPGSLYRLQKMARRNKLAFAATAAVAVSLLAGISFSSWQAYIATRAHGAEKEQRIVAQQERSNAVSAQIEAERQRNTAKVSEQNARSLLYAADMRLAQQAWDEGNLSWMTKLLEAHRPQPGQPDERGFEYYYLQNLAKGEQKEVFCHLTNEIISMEISPDGKWLAVNTTNEVLLWDFKSRTLVAKFDAIIEANFEDWPALSFSFDSEYLSIPSKSGLRLYSIPTGQISNLSTGIVTSAFFSPVTNLIAFNIYNADYTLTAKVWDCVNNRMVWNYRDKSENGAGFATAIFNWSSDGTRLFTGRNLPRVESWDTVTWTRTQTNYFDFSIVSAGSASSGPVLVAADSQHVVHFVDMISGKDEGGFFSGDINETLRFSPDGKLLATGSGNPSIQIWDVKTQQLVRQLRGRHGRIVDVVFTSDGQTLVSAGSDGDVMLWDPTHLAGNMIIKNRLVALNFNPIHFSPDGKWLALQTCFLINPTNDVIHNVTNLLIDSSLKTRAIFTEEVPSFSPDGRELLTITESRNPELEVRPTATPICRARVSLETDPSGVHFWFGPQMTPNGDAISLWIKYNKNNSWQNYLFDTCSGKLLFFLTNKCLRFHGVFLSDGHIWACPDGSKIFLYDIRTHSITSSISYKSEIFAMTGSRDGTTLAVGFGDNSIMIWNVNSGKLIRTLIGHQAAVNSLAFSPDGLTLASGSDDRTIKLWNLATGCELASFPQDRAVYYLAFSPDNQMLVSGGIGSYSFWRAPRDQDALPMPVIPKLSMADLPTNSIWRLPDGFGMTTLPVAN